MLESIIKYCNLLFVEMFFTFSQKQQISEQLSVQLDMIKNQKSCKGSFVSTGLIYTAL